MVKYDRAWQREAASVPAMGDIPASHEAFYKRQFRKGIAIHD